MPEKKCAREGCNKNLSAIPVVLGTNEGTRKKYCSARCLITATKEKKETEAAS